MTRLGGREARRAPHQVQEAPSGTAPACLHSHQNRVTFLGYGTTAGIRFRGCSGQFRMVSLDLNIPRQHRQGCRSTTGRGIGNWHGREAWKRRCLAKLGRSGLGLETYAPLAPQADTPGHAPGGTTTTGGHQADRNGFLHADHSDETRPHGYRKQPGLTCTGGSGTPSVGGLP